MKAFQYQLKINSMRLIFRNLRSLIFSLIFPVFFYILYSKVFVFPMNEAALIVWQKDYLLSMIIYGVLMTAVTSVGNALLMDHINHFDLFVGLSPTSKWQYTLSVVIVYLPFYFILTLILALVAFFVNGISLSIVEWLGFLIILIIAGIVFSFIGVLVSYGGSSTVVNVLSNLITFPFAILGGLWWPLEMMPNWIQSIGKMLPTYQVAQLSRLWIHERTLDFGLILGILAWALCLGALIYIIQLLMKRKEPQLI